MGRVVFITGISSGFGKDISRLLAEKGYTVYGTCRSECQHDPMVHLLHLDVTDSSKVKKCIDDVVAIEGRIDILINNAGMHTGGAIEVIPDAEAHLQIETNLFGAMNTVKAALPYMRKQRNGTIVNFGSIGGLMGLPFQGYYSASKFAIEGFSEALRMELRPFNIKVIVINPGDFHTNNTRNRKNTPASTLIPDYEEQFTKSISIIEKDEVGGWEPEILAKKIYHILEKKNPAYRYVISTFEQKLAVLLKRILPAAWFDAILRSHYGIK